MKRFAITFITIFLACVAITAKAGCPSDAPTVIEVCNDAGQNGTIRAYFHNGSPAISYYLFSLTTGQYVSDPLGPVTVNTSLPLPPGAVAAVEFGGVPDGDYVIRVNCSPSGSVNIGGFGINVNSANALSVGVTIDPDCNPLSGGANADGSITLNISGGTAPYDITWPASVTAISNTNNAAAGNTTFNNLDGGAYTAQVTDNANCVYSVSINVPVTTMPNAGADQAVCGSSATLNANAPLSGETGTWTGPGGVIFSPDANTPNAVASNLSVGINTLTWTITDTNAICAGSSDQVDITSDSPATVDAGSPQSICSGNAATLAGTFGGSATSATWTTSGDGTFDNATSLGAIYTPGSADISSGSVTLTLTTDDPAGPCVSVNDNVLITLDPAPAANAGGDQTICSGSTVTLAGAFGGGATGASWTTSGDGSFDNANLPNAVYTPGASDIAAGNVTLTFTTNDPAGPCLPATDDVIITINAPATAVAGAPQTICSGSTVTLAGSFGGTATNITWTTSGDGTFNDATQINAIYTPGAADIAAGNVTLTITTDDPAGPCLAATDNVLITISGAATVDAGAAQTICSGSTATLAGTFGGGASSITWTTAGDGAFNDANLLNAVYTPGAADIAAGNVTLTITTNDPAGPCLPATDNVLITINAPATADAGAPQTICSGSTVTLAGSFGGTATNIVWTTSGDGTFNDATQINAIYTPGAADIAAGNVTLTITTDDPAGPCLAATDNVVITINGAATVDAGSPQTICSGSTVTLAGTFGGGASGITWTTAGDGAFNDANLPNAVYTPGAADIAAGNITLTITSDDPAGPCLAATDNVVITINGAPTVDAGAPQTICAGGSVTLAGSFGGAATTASWTSSGDGTFNNAALTNAVYTPGSADVAVGSVTLTFTTNDPAGPCGAVNDNVVITINAGATVSAGADQSICSGSSANLAGSFGGAALSAIWTTSGDGTFNDPTLINAVYTPGAADFAGGTVALTFTTDDPAGPCVAVSDGVVITFSAPATVDAGAPQTICAGSTVTLAGSFGGAAGSAIWSTSGDGTFNNPSSLTATYAPGTSDIAGGSVTLTLTTDDPAGPCGAVSDNLSITIDAGAVANAGPDQVICSGATATLAGSIGGAATSATWTTSGNGTFDDANLSNAVYTPGSADVASGTVTLTFTTDDPAGVCGPVSDNIVITLSTPPTVDAGPAQNICSGGAVTLAGSLGGSATSATWTTSGDGTFDDATSLVAVYTPGAADIAAAALTLTLSTNDPAGPCGSVSDNVVITLDPPATAEAGNAQSVCSNVAATLSGSSVGGSAITGAWSLVSQPGGGDGALSSTAQTASPSSITFTASVAGNYTLRLTTDDPANTCGPATDDVVITILAAPTADAGAPQTICAGGTATLAGSFTGSTGITWTTSGDGTFNDATLGNAVYTPGANDKSNGSVTLTVTTGGPCASVNDNVVITIAPDPTVDAGLSQTICSSATVTLNASFGGAATGLLWTTSGDGTFDDNTDPFATYTPGPNDIINGSAILTATATGSCAGTTDNITITIDAAAAADAGTPQTICLGNNVLLGASIGGSATTLIWTTSGDGSFSNVNDANAVYTPGATDQSNGTVTLTITTDNPAGPCPAGSDQVVITFMPVPGDQTTAGNETWLGYVYDDAGDPAPIPARIDFANSKYRGFINETDIASMSGTSTYDTGTDQFDLNPGLALPLQGTNVCGTYLNTFSVRYKMNKTFTAGVYRFTAGADDGVRLLIDGADVLPASAFDLNSYSTYTSAPICLSAGAHQIEIQYFDNTAESRLTFNYQAVPALTTTSPVSVCMNDAAPVLTASGTDPDALGFNWYKNSTLVFSGSNYTPAGSELDMTTAATTTFQVTSLYACGETQPTPVVVNVVSSASLVINPQTVCETAGVVDLRTMVGESPPGGTFLFSGHPNISGNNFDPAGLSGTTVSITVDYSVGSCSAPTGTLDLTISNSATTTVPPIAVAVCESAPDIDLTSLVSSSPAGGTFTFTGSQITGNMFDPSGLTGLQTVAVNYTVGGCPAPQKTFQVDVKTTASITTTNISACKNGGSLNLLTLVSASPSGGIFTFTGPGVSGATFDPSAQSGTINVTVDYNANGCSTSGIVQITVLSSTDAMCTGGNCASVVIVPKPEAATCTNSDGKLTFSIKPFTPAINNTGIKITIDGTSSTNLSISRTNFNDTVFSALPVGTYDYSIEYGDPSCLKSGRVTIDQSGTVAAPVASDIIGPVCPGSATGSLTLAVPGETGNILEWSLDAGLSDPFKPFTAGGQITGIPAGPAPAFEQVISVRRNISDPCYAAVTVVVAETVQDISAAFTITDATCNGNDGGISNIAASEGNGAPYTFSLDGGQSFQTQNSFNGLAGGGYSLRVRDAAGCEKDFPANVTFPGFINSVITKTDANCSNNGNSGSISVRIDDPGVFKVALTTDQFSQPADSLYLPYTNPAISFNDIPRGQYYVYVKSDNGECPTRSAPIDIFGVYPIRFDVEPDCNENELSIGLINVTGDPNGAPLEIQVFKKLSSDPPEIIYKQFPANGQIYLDHDLYAFLQTAGEYQIKIVQFQNQVVCNLSSGIVDLNVPAPLTAQVGPVSESYPDIPTGKLDLTGFSGGMDPYKVRIELDSAASIALQEYATNFEPPLINGNQEFEMAYQNIPAGRYQVIVTDSLGCTLTLVARVPLDKDLFVPNVFTPNGDGSNDVFFIRNLPGAPAVNQLIISNRWGKEVFASKNYQNNWDGEGVADGLYYYRLKVVDGDPITGWVEIMRGPKP